MCLATIRQGIWVNEVGGVFKAEGIVASGNEGEGVFLEGLDTADVHGLCSCVNQDTDLCLNELGTINDFSDVTAGGWYDNDGVLSPGEENSIADCPDVASPPSCV